MGTRHIWRISSSSNDWDRYDVWYNGIADEIGRSGWEWLARRRKDMMMNETFFDKGLGIDYDVDSFASDWVNNGTAEYDPINLVKFLIKDIKANGSDARLPKDWYRRDGHAGLKLYNLWYLDFMALLKKQSPEAWQYWNKKYTYKGRKRDRSDDLYYLVLEDKFFKKLAEPQDAVDWAIREYEKKTRNRKGKGASAEVGEGEIDSARRRSLMSKIDTSLWDVSITPWDYEDNLGGEGEEEYYEILYKVFDILDEEGIDTRNDKTGVTRAFEKVWDESTTLDPDVLADRVKEVLALSSRIRRRAHARADRFSSRDSRMRIQSSIELERLLEFVDRYGDDVHRHLRMDDPSHFDVWIGTGWAVPYATYFEDVSPGEWEGRLFDEQMELWEYCEENGYEDLFMKYYLVFDPRDDENPDVYGAPGARNERLYIADKDPLIELEAISILLALREGISLQEAVEDLEALDRDCKEMGY